MIFMRFFPLWVDYIISFTVVFWILFFFSARIFWKLSIFAAILQGIFQIIYFVERNIFRTRVEPIADDEDTTTPEYKKKAALQGLDSRELAFLTWFELLNGKLKSTPEVDDYFIDKTRAKEDILTEVSEIQSHSPDSPHIILAGPFYTPNEEINFKKTESERMSLYFNFAKKKKNPSKICFLHIHGGAYFLGAAKSCHIHEKFCAKNGVNLLGLEYSLYPHAQIEDMIEEAFSAFEWLVNEKQMEEIYLMGESAGANLSLLLCERIANIEQDEKNYKSILKGAILFSPWLNLTLKGTDSIGDLDHQDRCIQNNMIRLWKINGVPCGLGQQERAKLHSPSLWSMDRINNVVNQTIPKGIFVSYSERERFIDEIEMFLAKLSKTNVKLAKHKEKIPFHAFHMLSDLLPDHYQRAMNGVSNFIKN